MTDKAINKIPEVERRVINITNPTIEGSIQLKAKPERKRNTEEVAAELCTFHIDICCVLCTYNYTTVRSLGSDLRLLRYYIP